METPICLWCLQVDEVVDITMGLDGTNEINSSSSEEEDLETVDVSPANASRRSDRKKCQICMQEYKEFDQLCVSNNPQCHHQFHEQCMAKWLKHQNLCPICDKTYVLVDV